MFKKNKEMDKKIDKLSYDVMHNGATERPFSSELNDEFRKGIYVDKEDGTPLFSSSDKFNAGCGWPSFSKPIGSNEIDEKLDTSYGMIRTEVKSSSSGIHLGHKFDDGPIEMGGLRYCINGASLLFIPYEKMDEEGYSEYKKYVK